MPIPVIAAAAGRRWIIPVVIIVGVFLLLLAVWLWGRSSRKNAPPPPPAPLPNNGSGIPSGWSPGGPAKELYTAMNGWGTTAASIWSALDPLTADQRTAVYNEFNRLYSSGSNSYTSWTGCGLGCWFAGDLSGTDLSRANAYFSHILDYQ